MSHICISNIQIMRRLFLVLAWAISFSVLGHDATSDFRGLQPGLSISPDICTRTLRDVNLDGLLKFTDDGADLKIGYTTGISVLYIFSYHWGIEIGVQYSNKGYQNTSSNISYGDCIGGDIFYETQDPVIDMVTIRNNYHYFDIPLRILYQAGQNNLRFISSIGVAPNFLLNVTDVRIATYNDGNANRRVYDLPNGYNTFGLSPSLSVGMGYQMGRFNLSGEPTFRYGLLKTRENAFYSENLLSAGIDFTCYISLVQGQ